MTLPEGLVHVPGFLTEAQERGVLAVLATFELQPYVLHDTPSRRLVRSFGIARVAGAYDAGPAAPIPAEPEARDVVKVTWPVRGVGRMGGSSGSAMPGRPDDQARCGSIIVIPAGQAVSSAGSRAAASSRLMTRSTRSCGRRAPLSMSASMAG
jgi:hypothetical protein